MEATDLGPGTALGEDGRYLLRSLLGAGGMASVWLADDRRLGRPVAIKLLAEQLSHDHTYRQRLIREARVAARLSHPNLVGVFDFSPGPPRPYLVMEYVAGGTLADALRAGRRVEPERLLRELLGAVAEVHRAGIIHRDVKPANVLMDPAGRPRLTDFGIARPSEATSLTATGLVIGTQRYIAPEVLAGEAADFRSDLYSLGVLLRECLNEASPQRLHRIGDRFAAVDPQRRPSSAAAALAELEEATASTLLNRRAHGFTQTVTRRLERAPRRRPAVRVRRAPAAALATAAAAILLVIVLASAGGGSRPSRPALTVPAPSAPLSTQLAALQRDLSRARR